MSPKWTAERDQHLLLLIINNTRIDFNDIAKRWAEKFVNEDFKPSPKAILEHVAKLKRGMKEHAGPGGKAASTPKSTPRATPVSKRTTPFKTPQSRKRSKTTMSDDDQDDDEEPLDSGTPLPKRQMTSRRSKARTASYVDAESSADGGANEPRSDDEFDAVFASVKTEVRDKDADGHNPQKRDSVVQSDGGKGNATAVRDYMAESDSDVSDFRPHA